MLLLLVACHKPVPAVAVPAVVVSRRPGDIVVDGVLDEAAWVGAEVPGPDETVVVMRWDDEALWFGATMRDADLLATVAERDGRTWRDDVFELFLRPADGGYVEIEVTANNVVLDLLIRERGPDAYALYATGDDLGLVTAVTVHGTVNDPSDTDTGFVVEGRLPWSGIRPLGAPPSVGDVWRFHTARYDHHTGADPHLSSSAPLSVLDFHRYEEWFRLNFQE